MILKHALPRSPFPRRGFTLIEAIVTVAVLAVIMMLTAPSALDWLIIQRVKASASELVTDIRFARGESIKRNQRVVVAFKSVGDQSCYVVHTRYFGPICDCTKGAGNSCNTSDDPTMPELSDTLVELKTVTVQTSTRVVMTAVPVNESFIAPNGFPDNVNFRVDFDGQNSRLLRVVTNAAGRPIICAPVGSRIAGYPSCA